MMTRFGGPAPAAMLLLLATPLVAQRSDRRVLDRAAIADAGWHRLGDIVAALPPGSAASVDGFNHELRGSRVGFRQTNGVGATWTIRLDGQIMPMHIGGVWILDEIPVAITQLDSIVIAEGPQLTEGRAALLGTIDLYTRRARGPSLVADYQHGDETGDPGPYRYTPRATPNVEKIGPFSSGAAAVGNAAGALDVAARYSSLNITDQRLTDRLGTSLAAYQPDVNASGGSGVATVDLPGGRSYLVAGRGRFTGFFPTADSGVDQQLRIVATHAGLSGSLRAAQRNWRYAATTTALDVDRLGTVAKVTPDTRRVFADGLVEGEIARGLQLGIGATMGRRQTDIEDRRTTSARGWALYSPRYGVGSFALERSAGRMRFSSSVRVEGAVSDSDRIAVTVTTLEAWRDGDFAWMDRNTGDSSGATALDLRADLTTRAIGSARPTWYARTFLYSGVGDSDVRGLAAGVVATTSLTSAIMARVRGEVTQLLGDAGPGESSTPAGYVEGDISARVAGGFRLALAGRFAPGAHWSGSVDDVPAVRRIDFSMNKAMWRDRVRAQLVMRNLLNTAERTHPGGAQWNMRTHLAITVALPSGAGAP